MTEKKENIGKSQRLKADKSESFKFPPELQEILAEHHTWLESQGKEGKQANLSGKDLSGLDLGERDLRDSNFEGAQLMKSNLSWAELDRANLSHANLNEAILTRAHLKGADLRHANLEKADLTQANLQNAKLLEANFQETNLYKTDFRDADLQDAKLAQSQNLLGRQLGGANLSAAELPGSVSRFEELAHAGEITKTTATLLWTLLTGCLYATLTVATTKDDSFFVMAAQLKLPIIDASIPTWGFFILAPIVLLGWYFYFLLNLQRLWEVLITLPALFPDGMRLDQKASPWFITGLVCSYFSQLQMQAQKPPFLRIQKFLSLVLVWWIVPLTMIFIWIGYLKARFWLITSVQILAIGLAIFLGFWTWRVAKATLRGEPLRPQMRDLAYALISFLVLLGLSVEIINLVPPRLEAELYSEYKNQQSFGLYGHYLHEKINKHLPRIGPFIEWVFSRPFVNIDDAEVSFKPEGWPEDSDKQGDEKIAKYIEKVKGARLGYTNLRHGHAARVFLAKAKMEDAKLDGAYLYKADLRGADLPGASFFNAFLAEAYLQGANLKGVNFRRADLRGVNFKGANLKGAALKDANLERADFSEAEDLTGDQIKAARCWKLASYHPELIKELKLHENHNQRLKDKNLSGYNFQGEKLEGANLKKFNLVKAKFQGTDLRKANLIEADLTGADFENAQLEGADLKGAILNEVKNLDQKQRESAKNIKDKSTQLPK